MKLNQDKLVNYRKSNYSKEKEKFDKVIQESIFGILYVLLKDDQPNFYLFLFLTITEYMEFLQFPFSSELLKYWDNNPIASTIIDYINYIDILFYLKKKEPFVYLLVYYIFVFLVTLVILNIAYVFYSFSRQYFTYTWPLYVLSKTAKIFITILFLPVLNLNLSLFVCEKKPDGKYYNTTSTNLECFVGFYFVHMATSLIISIIFFTICVFSVVNFFECSECEEDFEAK
jgi:hypothetical protein